MIICLMAWGGLLQTACGATLATSDETPFRLNTLDTSPVIYEADLLIDRPVTWQPGETVTLTAPDGTVSNLVEDAASASSAPVTIDRGGLWILECSTGDTVIIGVPWTTFGDSGLLDTAATAFAAHTVGPGPDRKLYKKEIPPVAYTGDSWKRDSETASVLTFISPDGVPSAFDLKGNGVMPYIFNRYGEWKVRLSMGDGLTLESTLKVLQSGSAMIFN